MTKLKIILSQHLKTFCVLKTVVQINIFVKTMIQDSRMNQKNSIYLK